MATADQLRALVDSHTLGDDQRFRAVAMQVAAKAAQQGKHRLADELRRLLDESAVPRKLHVGQTRAVPIARPSQELAGLLSASYPKTRLSSMVLDAPLRRELELVVHEYTQRDTLRAHGLEPRLRLLLIGPPGTGKTMTAAGLAGECGLPLFSVQLHGLITKFMGETAAKLHQVFEAMEQTPGVYLFDEFDAIGSIRGGSQDVGEIRRVLNSFLQFLEQHQADSLVVAATNLRSLLDDALFRRFDSVFRYRLPETEDIVRLIKNRLTTFKLVRIDWSAVTQAAEKLSQAEIVRAAEDAAKRCVLAQRQTLKTSDLVAALQVRNEHRSE